MKNQDRVRSVLSGTPVVGGVAYAPALWVGTTLPSVSTEPSPDLAAEGAEERQAAEKDRLAVAAKAVADRLRGRAENASGAAAEVLAANAQLASDRGWLKTAGKQIARGVPAEGAARLATETFVAMFDKLGGRQAERITDLEDVCARIVAELLGLPEPGIPQLEEPAVLLAPDLAPADTAGLDPSFVRAIVTEYGGPTSHTAIIARQLGIPCVVAASGLEDVPSDQPLLVDGLRGTITTDADPEAATQMAEQDAAARARAAGWTGPAALSDGTPVDLLANVQDGATARKAAGGPAGGVGLFRTELAFLDRDHEPSVSEQAELYGEVLAAFPGQKVVVRTLDAGSDKPVAFAGLPHEANPALGVRGLRIDRLDHGLLDRQLDAIAAAAAGCQDHRPEDTWVMAPMVATVAEAADFASRCRERGLRPGVMIEVPAAALLISSLLPLVDFVSIGTNDLTQYTMAADRMSPHLAELSDPWQPAVLNLIAHVARSATAFESTDGRHVTVGVCGEAAADPTLAAVLVGMEVDYLSAAASALPFVGSALSELSRKDCEEMAAAALAAPGATEAKDAALAIRHRHEGSPTDRH